MVKSKIFIAIIIILIIVFAVLLFLPKTSTETIKIGVILPLTGPVAMAGNQIRQGLDLAVEEGYKEKIELIFEDSQCRPANTVTAIQKLIELNDISLVLGDICSSATLAMLPITKEYNLVIITPLSSNTKITQSDNNAYRIIYSSQQQFSYMANYVYDKLKIKNLAIVYENTDFGKEGESILKDSYKGTITISEGYDPDTNDYRTILTKVKQKNPEGIYMVSLPQQIGLILKQAKELELNTVFISINAVEQQVVLDIAGDAANGVIYDFFSEGPEEIVNVFKKSFKEKFNKEPGAFEAIGYDMGKIMLLAVKETQGDKEKIKQNIKKSSFEGATGHIEFDESGNMKERGMLIKTVKDGEFVKYEIQ